MITQVTDEKSINDALKGVTQGSNLRITFRLDVGEKFQQETFLQLRHKLEFDTMWLTVAHNTLAMCGEWKDVPRTQDFTITRMSDADRQIFAHILTELAESVELL